MRLIEVAGKSFASAVPPGAAWPRRCRHPGGRMAVLGSLEDSGDGPSVRRVGGPAGAALLLRRAEAPVAGRGARADAAGDGEHLPVLSGAAGGSRARGASGRVAETAPSARYCRTCSASARCCCAGEALWRVGTALPEPYGRPRHRAAVRGRHGRAAGQGRRVLPRQLRRVADQAGAGLRLPVRGLRRHADVLDHGQPRAAGVRFGGAVALRPAAGRRAAGPHRSSPALVRRAADPPPPGAGRRARGGDRPGVGPRRRQS